MGALYILNFILVQILTNVSLNICHDEAEFFNWYKNWFNGNVYIQSPLIGHYDNGHVYIQQLMTKG